MNKLEWKVLYSKSAMQEIDSLDGSIKKIIKKVIEQKLAVDPLKYGLPLRRNLAGLFKLRVADYRIVYSILEKEVVVLVVSVGHRKNIYQKI